MNKRPIQTCNGLKALTALRSKLDAASSLEVIQEGGHLFQAHFTFNPPAEVKEVEELKRSLHMPLPFAYEQFLLQCNGALLYYDDEYGQWGFDLYGTKDLIPINIECWKIFGDEWPPA